jgi:ribosomal protein S18 acetylase RimI-like enzyme
VAEPTIKWLTREDHALLEEFVYLAIWLPAGTPPLPREVIRTEPSLRHYWEDFGKVDDHACHAVVEGQTVGMAWSRLLGGDHRGYGWVDDHTPEVGVSVVPELRGLGIGTRLINELLTALDEAGHKQVSLSVAKENPAVRLYRRLGFTAVGENDADFIMVKPLA